MINAIIIDDEQLNISNLEALINKNCTGIQIVATASNVKDAENVILTHNPDVVFLDIQMPEKNGFELLKAISPITFEVVFVTAYDSYGLMAIKFSALDYLLKPISIPNLIETVDKIKIAVSVKHENKRLNNLLAMLDKKQYDENEKIALPTLKQTYLVPIKDILSCESANNYTTIYLTDGTSYLISKPMYEYDEMLKPYGFIRPHQSHLVNKKHVKGILNEDSGYLVLSFSDKKIPISKQRKAEIKSLLNI